MIKNIKLLNKIAKVGTDKLDRELFNVGEDVEAPYGIMVRSANMLDMEFNPELRAIARAGAGVNNIPIDRCTEHGVVVFNTPGANANAVKELVIGATTEDIFVNALFVFYIEITVQLTQFSRHFIRIIGVRVILLVKLAPRKSTHFAFYIGKDT